MRPTTFAGKSVLVTGANRGLGQALVDEALRRGAQTRLCRNATGAHMCGRARHARMFDVTDRRQFQPALDTLEALDNAGVSVADGLNDRSAFERRLAVNLYGTLDVTRVALPLLTRSRGAVVNVVSVGAMAA